MGLPFVLIDFENVQPAALGRLRVGEVRVKVFLGQQQSKLGLQLVQALQPFGGDAEYIQIQGSGPDAVDFHIAFYIGQISVAEPTASFTIVSKDKGFDPLVRHLVGKGIACRRLAEIPALPSNHAVKSPDASAIAAMPPAPTKSTAATKAPVLTPPAKTVAKTAPSAPAAKVVKKPAAKAAKKAAPPITTPRARARLIVDNLKKSTKPATIVTLRAMIKSFFTPHLEEKQIDAILQSLKDTKKVSVVGTKPHYTLG